MSAAPGTAGRLRVVAGSPTAEELAALVCALQPAQEQRDGAPQRPAWLSAARMEGLGGPPVHSAADLRTYRL